MKQSCGARWGVCVVALWLVAAAAAVPLSASDTGAGCSEDQFSCSNGRCVPLIFFCDGDDDCEDGSDESDCPVQECSSEQFSCSNGRCVPASYLCDADNDCGDNSDEWDCAGGCDPATEFRCSDGSCVPLHHVCDKITHCADESDESECSGCGGDEFRCGTGQCVRLYSVCDNYKHCGDGSDEINCWSSNRDCDPATEFNCSNGNCVPLRYVCDSMDDCGDRSDEKECSECGGDGFRCDDGGCMLERNTAKDFNHCDDHSQYARFEECDPETEFKCNFGKCVPLRYVCDGIDDCWDESDEVECPVSRCRAGEFRCSSGECVPLRQFCDGAQDCRGGDDEAYNLCTRISEGLSGGNSSRQDVEPSVRCAAPYTAVRNMCLLSVTTPVPWTSARDICLKQGGYLADIDAVEDLIYINRHLQQEAGGEPLPHPYWVGLTNVPDREFGWKWLWVSGRIEPRFSPLMTYHEPATRRRLCGYIPLAPGGHHLATHVASANCYLEKFAFCRSTPLD